MTSEPTEEAIANFVSFTSSSREQAISFLKANNLNSNQAINAYFEDPTGPQTQSVSYQNDPNVSSFQIEHSDPAPDPSIAAPSRPPSTLNLNERLSGADYPHNTPAPSQNNTDTSKGLSLAEQEERELQQAVAMSLNQNLGQQETGVTSTKDSKFSRATRDHYEEGAWAMTLFNSSSREIIISPDPADRKRREGEPPFIRPSQDNLYLSGFLTILHSIPLAREALMLRSRLLSNYGHDPQWWNGQPINLPKIVTIHDAQDGDTEWDDIIYETQRIMALLDSTRRAFGSIDALASLKSMASYDSDGSVSRFLESWQEAAIRADQGNQLATIFSSTAYKRPLSVYDTPIDKEFSTLNPFVEREHGQSLYDVLDHTMWSDRPGEELDDVWLEHVAEVFTIKLDGADKPLDVKIPAVFYPDRYLAASRDLARDFRTQRLQVYEEIFRLEGLINRFSTSKKSIYRGMTSKETLDKAAAAVSSTLPKSLSRGTNAFTPETANAEAQRLTNELKAISDKIENKLKELEVKKSEALESLRGYSKILTEASSTGEQPHAKYTLRGVCTEPHVTYLLKRHVSDGSADASESTTPNEYQWWRISFSTDDAKARQAESDQKNNATLDNADVIGYTARKVQEAEVLQAAREESKSVLLVYANSNAMDQPEEPAPPPLQGFVHTDNQAFEAECQEAEGARNETEHQTPELNASEPQDQQPTDTTQNVNVFDYQVPSFDESSGQRQGQEMEERGGGRPLLSRSSTAGPVQPSQNADAMWEVVDEDKAA
ncbi:ubiquitin interaction motif protein [Aspergillus ellipticus CBS 707.79]|uniref:Ubiquitin interaction motif protein n=1 Tax=Aspergillus ellipticus CBS 707.79 TaxID=1448320 RepID=A0A319EVC0_9EURO|nr:ubiquitin interaction motif protein [Aspergillus ellipticus CBS 707.79]